MSTDKRDKDKTHIRKHEKCLNITHPHLSFFGFCLVATQLARQLHLKSGTHTGGSSVIGKPRSARLEGTPAMDHGINGKRMHM